MALVKSQTERAFKSDFRIGREWGWPGGTGTFLPAVIMVWCGCCDYYLYCIVLRLALPRLTPFREGSLLVVLADTNAYYNVTIHGRHTFRWRDLRLLVLVAAALWLSICFYHIDLSSILNLSIEYRSPRIST